MREIGSEFWDIPTKPGNNIFGKQVEWFISGRSALLAIIDDSGIKSVSLPSWCCETMIRPFAERNVVVKFYPVYGSVQMIDCVNTDALLIMDYFGYYGHSFVPAGYKGIVIRDLTHSLFSGKYDDADYYYGSLRKWAGFWTGGYAWGFKHDVNYGEADQAYSELRACAMEEKSRYIEGKTSNKNYLSIFSKAEKILDTVKILPGNQRDFMYAQKLDINEVKSKRCRNAKKLLSELKEFALFQDIQETDCPLFVPVKVKNRDGLKKYLIKNEIYCPIHWPISEYHELNEETKQIYNEELSLVCDQRYDIEDMQRIVDAIHNFWGKVGNCA